MYKRLFTDQTPSTLYDLIRNGVNIGSFLASPQGVVVANTALGGGSIVLSSSATTEFAPVQTAGKLIAMISPSPGETFYRNPDLRLVCCANDFSRFGGPAGTDHAADFVEFFVDSTLIATVQDTDNAEFSVFKTRVSLTLAPGTHTVWARAHWLGGGTADSVVRNIQISEPPTYGSTINLVGNVDWTGLALSLIGSAGSRIKVNGNGFKYIGTPTSINLQFVDFFNMGASSGFNSNYGIDLTTAGNTTIISCIFDSCCSSKFINNGSSLVTIQNNLSRSNSRNPLGQTPDFSGGDAHGSFPWVELRGSSSGVKIFEGNNAAAGWAVFSSPSWTIGGNTAAKGNIALGARVGLYGEIGFTGNLKFNYSHHIYYGGWSQGANHEWWDTNPLIEHNIIVGSSWPCRGIEGTFRYNLVLGPGVSGLGEEALLWMHTGAADIHHNVFRDGSMGRGMLYGIYAAAGAFVRNNTLDGVDQAGSPLTELANGTYTYNSNVFMRGSGPLSITAPASMTRNFNLFFNNLGAQNYSDGINGANDSNANPAFNNAPGMIPYNVQSVWERSLTVPTLLALYRTYYQPTNTNADVGDTTYYGANNPKGAICRSGVVNAFDLFGTL